MTTKSDRIYKGIVIGCGQIGVLYEGVDGRPHPRSHASALAANPRTELSAFVGLNEAECARAVSYFPSTPAYISLDQCLKEIRPDIAIIAASTAAHASLVEACTKAGMPIIIGEKPLADTMQSGLDIERAIKASGSVFTLNYQRRYFPLFEQAAARIAKGELGRIEKIECHYDNGLFNNGGHMIDSIQLLTGDRFISASGTEEVGNNMHPAGDLNIDGNAQLAGGARVVFKSFDKISHPVHDLYVSGDKGSLHILDFGYVFEWRDASGKEIGREEDRISMTAGALQDALESFETKHLPRSGLLNGLQTLAALEAFRRSAQKGGSSVEVAYTGVV